MKKYVQLSRAELGRKHKELIEVEKNLQQIRRKRLNELIAFIFPIRRISVDEE